MPVCPFSQYVDCADHPVGPLTALETEAPVYRTAAICMMAGYMLKTICHCLLWFYVSVRFSSSVTLTS